MQLLAPSGALAEATVDFRLAPYLRPGSPSVLYLHHLPQEGPVSGSSICYLAAANGMVTNLASGCRLAPAAPEVTPTLDWQLGEARALYSAYYDAFHSGRIGSGGMRTGVAVAHDDGLPGGFDDEAPGGAKGGVLFVAEVSHPAARIAGAYAAAVGGSAGAQASHTLAQWAGDAANRETSSNAAVRRLCGAPCGEVKVLTRSHLKRAVSNLRHFPLVLLRERPGESLALLRARLGWEPAARRAGNVFNLKSPLHKKGKVLKREDPHSAASIARGYAAVHWEEVDVTVGGSGPGGDGRLAAAALEAGEEAFAPPLATWEAAAEGVAGGQPDLDAAVRLLKKGNALDLELYALAAERFKCQLDELAALAAGAHSTSTATSAELIRPAGA